VIVREVGVVHGRHALDIDRGQDGPKAARSPAVRVNRPSQSRSSSSTSSAVSSNSLWMTTDSSLTNAQQADHGLLKLLGGEHRLPSPLPTPRSARLPLRR
jgi:hypothetical protein